MGWFSAMIERRTVRTWTVLAIVGTLAMAMIAFVGIASANPSCTNSLVNSDFEIDPSANLKVDGATLCIDWLAGGSGSNLRLGVFAKADKPSGAGDDSFGQGTKEDTSQPTIVDGSIPPNKSDLKNFGVYKESNANGKFLELFWTRINSPQGTTNMDFELNKLFCDPTATPTNCANNSHQPPETPLRSVGDKLITYDLSKGGTVPTISIRTWNGTQWGTPTVISGGTGGQPCNTPAPGNNCALGSVNTSGISAADAGGVGPLDPYTFGEASIDFKALFSGVSGCGKFGSAYLKSRSSDSFTSELKDFIAPEAVTITNCTNITTKLSAESITPGQQVTDSSTLENATPTAGGSVTYKVYTNDTCTNLFANAGTKTVTNGVVPNSDPVTFNTPGDYYWQAVYTGDPSNAASTSECKSEHLVVSKKSPTISTLLSSTSITVGSKAHDSATLTGATADAGGTVTYTVYTDSNCSQGAQDAGTKTVTNGSVPDSDELTFNKAADYYWQAVYSGDANNSGTTSTCTDEKLVVGKAPSNISTAQELRPQDSATISAGAGGTPTGTVDFALYGPNNPTCDPNGAAAVYTESGVKLDGSGKASTSNTTFSVTSANSSQYHWKAVYSGDSTHDPITSNCTENFTLTIVN